MQEEQATLTESEAISYVVYTLAKLGYPREKIMNVIKELNHTFKLKCDAFTFNASIKVGKEDRRNMLPTIRNVKGNGNCDNSSVQDKEIN